MIDQKLDIRSLTKRFTLHIRDGLRVQGIEHVSLRVARGEFLGLIGHSGSGKSSLLKCLYRTYLPDSGSAWYTTPDARLVDLATADEHTVLGLRRGAIGYVSQSLRVIPRVTVEQTVARAGQPDEPEALTRARNLLARLNLAEGLWGSFPSLLSGGEQQRVNIARSLMTSPDLLLLDEPTSALDGPNQRAVVELLEEHLRRGATMVGVFHDAPSLQRIASRTARLEGGRLMELSEAREPALAGGAA